jgi:hypothetical protein
MKMLTILLFSSIFLLTTTAMSGFEVKKKIDQFEEITKIFMNDSEFLNDTSDSYLKIIGSKQIDNQDHEQYFLEVQCFSIIKDNWLYFKAGDLIAKNFGTVVDVPLDKGRWTGYVKVRFDDYPDTIVDAIAPIFSGQDDFGSPPKKDSKVLVDYIGGQYTIVGYYSYTSKENLLLFSIDNNVFCELLPFTNPIADVRKLSLAESFLKSFLEETKKFLVEETMKFLFGKTKKYSSTENQNYYEDDKYGYESCLYRVTPDLLIAISTLSSIKVVIKGKNKDLVATFPSELIKQFEEFCICCGLKGIETGGIIYIGKGGETGLGYEVDVGKGTCDCPYFKKTGKMCTHLIEAIKKSATIVCAQCGGSFRIPKDSLKLYKSFEVKTVCPLCKTYLFLYYDETRKCWMSKLFKEE